MSAGITAGLDNRRACWLCGLTAGDQHGLRPLYGWDFATLMCAQYVIINLYGALAALS